MLRLEQKLTMAKECVGAAKQQLDECTLMWKKRCDSLPIADAKVKNALHEQDRAVSALDVTQKALAAVLTRQACQLLQNASLVVCRTSPPSGLPERRKHCRKRIP